MSVATGLDRFPVGVRVYAHVRLLNAHVTPGLLPLQHDPDSVSFTTDVHPSE